MALRDVPIEVLDDIFARTIHSIGLRNGIELRLVCRQFSELIESVVFRLPSCVIVREGISKPMAAKLILSKLKHGNADKLPLCRAIKQTAHYLVSTFNQSDALRLNYIQVLAAAAAQSMFLWHILSKLEPEENKIAYPRTTKNSALIAAIGANQPAIVKNLLELGADAAAKTQFFGEPLSLAACMGFADILRLLLDSRDWTEPGNYFAHVRFRHAVEVAAETGQEKTVLILLKLENDYSQLASLYDSAIINAIRATQESIAKRLLSRRRSKSQFSNNRNFWLELVRVVIRCNRQAFLREIWDEAFSFLGKEPIGLLVEDACRHGYIELVQFLILHTSNQSPSDYSGGLFWAAHSGYTALVDILIDFLAGNISAITRALAGAASGNQHDLLYHLLKRFGIERNNSSQRIQFSDAIHLIYPHLPPRVPYRSTANDPLPRVLLPPQRCKTPEEKAFLDHASSTGDLESTVAIFCEFAAKHQDDSLNVFSGSFSAAAQNNHPDILLYLCENRHPYLYSPSANSTAILRIFFDFGWDINQSDIGIHRPRLGAYIHDEHLLRWLLNNGADATARGDWDITPTSVAAVQSSLLIFKLLLERGGNVDKGQLLHFAIQRHSADELERIELLLDLGCPINAIMYENDPWCRMMYKTRGAGTPLFDAAAIGRADIVTYLLQQGADPTIKNTKGRTALQAAEAGGCTEVVGILKSWEVERLKSL